MSELTREELARLLREEEEGDRLEAYREWKEHNPYPHDEQGEEDET